MLCSLLARVLPDRKRGLFIKFCIIALLGTAAWAEELTLTAMGDSLTQGFGLPPEAGFVPQLQAYLDAEGQQVKVINAGVSGDTSAGGLSRIDWTLSDAPNAVLLALGANDALRGLPVAELRANLDAMLARFAQSGVPVLLVGIDVPSNFGAAYRTEFQAVYPDLAAKHGVPLMPNFMQGLADQGDLASVLRDYMQPDGIHPNAAGVSLIVEAMGPKVVELLTKARP